ncbi:FG-GAP-like repeat-containing protein [Streptomyces sp. NPDC058739]|uniref:FG-GAP-like repeat-containing protein n=1 Tax=Streptomyces sp. NPDC058739 TaxID=3346618 RepID=UPI0036921906
MGVLVGALSLGLSLSVLPLSATGAPEAGEAAAVAEELVLPAAPRSVPRFTRILNAGTSGFLWAQEGDARFLWSDYATGATTALEQSLDVPIKYSVDHGTVLTELSFAKGHYGKGSDTVAFYSEEDAQVTLLQGAGASGASGVVPVPQGHTYSGTFGDTVVTRADAVQGATALHLWRAGDMGDITRTAVTGAPEGASSFGVSDGDARSLLVQYLLAGDTEGWRRWGLVDLATGAFSAMPGLIPPPNGSSGTAFQLGAKSVLRLRWGSGEADLYDRDNPSAAPRTFDTTSLNARAAYGIVGDKLLGVDPMSADDMDLDDVAYRGRPLWALAAESTGTAPAKVMDPAAQQLVQAPDGSVLVAGAARYLDRGDLDWAVYRVGQAADGSVTRSRLTTVEPMPAQIHGLSLGSGILTTADNSTLYDPKRDVVGGYRSTWLTVNADGTTSVARTSVDGLISPWDDGSCSTTAPRCIPMFADGTGRHGRRGATEADLTALRANGATGWGPSLDTDDGNPVLTDLSGRYAVVDGRSSGTQYIGEFADFGAGKVVLKRARVAAAVWGNTLWSGAASGGKVTATRLPAGTVVESFTTRDGCTPSELQAVGRWVYWLCQDSSGENLGSGVYDRTTRRTATAPAGHVLLGDGYLVQHIGGIGSASGLSLVDLHGGLPVSGDHTELPSRKLAGWTDLGRENTGARTSWTVDRFGGAVAYADRDQRVHIVPTGVPASALTAVDSAVVPSSTGWSGRWWLSKPAGSWQITLRHKASGATVRTLTGSTARGLLAASWDGKDTTGRLVTNGLYTWTLTAGPADGQGVPLTLSGTTAVTAGAAAPRDHAGNDGVGDLLALTSSGTLTVQRGTGTGTLGAKVSGSGWATSSLFVPYGDLDGDRCNDVLVGLSSGALRAHRPGCGKAVTPSTPYTSLGTGWNQYDVLTSPGDVNGDRRPDLIARQASTADVYLYMGTSTGKLSARLKIGSRWTGYKRLVGVGDLNGDGRGDLLAQDRSNELWRIDATASSTGGFKARVKVFTDWGASYNAVVGAGDFTGDGRTDLVVRDTSGSLWRLNGNGKGSFGGRVRIATGWQVYRAVV